MVPWRHPFELAVEENDQRLKHAGDKQKEKEEGEQSRLAQQKGLIYGSTMVAGFGGTVEEVEDWLQICPHMYK